MRKDCRSEWYHIHFPGIRNPKPRFNPGGGAARDRPLVTARQLDTARETRRAPGKYPVRFFPFCPCAPPARESDVREAHAKSPALSPRLVRAKCTGGVPVIRLWSPRPPAPPAPPFQSAD